MVAIYDIVEFIDIMKRLGKNPNFHFSNSVWKTLVAKIIKTESCQYWKNGFEFLEFHLIVVKSHLHKKINACK